MPPDIPEAAVEAGMTESLSAARVPLPAGLEAAFRAGGHLGARMRELDWAQTALGDVSGWPQSLVSSISILLTSKAQIAMFWGRDYVALYNDAYAPTIGAKHPNALGRPAREHWAEMWDVLEPLLDGVRQTGTAFAATDYPFFIDRHGFLEEVFFDISYDPIRIEDGSVGGVFCIVSETTARVLTERRLRALHALDTGTAAATTTDDVLAGVVSALRALSADVPWASLHVSDPADLQVRVRTFGEPFGGSAIEQVVSRLLATEETADVVHDGRTVAVAIPLTSATRTIGVAVLGVNESYRLNADYRDFLASIAARTSTALANAHLFQAEHTIAATLQRAILPARLPQPPTARLAARYLPATTGVEVGGDWYDAFPLPGERLALVIGDVVGKGVRAAASMGQLRNALRAYLLDGSSPAAALERLDRFATLLDEQDFATALCAVVDLDTGRLDWASAGHLPPLLIDRRGSARFLDVRPGLPVGLVGVAAGSYPTFADDLQPGETLVLYTDGLVEERGTDIEVGMTRMAAAAADAAHSVDGVVDALASLRAQSRFDDVAILALRREP